MLWLPHLVYNDVHKLKNNHMNRIFTEDVVWVGRGHYSSMCRCDYCRPLSSLLPSAPLLLCEMPPDPFLAPRD